MIIIINIYLVWLFSGYFFDKTAGKFLLVFDQLVVQQIPALRRNHTKHRQLLFNQRNRAVFQFTRRKALGMDVRQFLEFERTLQGDRIADVPAQE